MKSTVAAYFALLLWKRTHSWVQWLYVYNRAVSVSYCQLLDCFYPSVDLDRRRSLMKFIFSLCVQKINTSIFCVCVCLCVHLHVCGGFKVAVISRDSSRLERLRSFVSPKTKDNLTAIVGNVGEFSASSLFSLPYSTHVFENSSNLPFIRNYKLSLQQRGCREENF